MPPATAFPGTRLSPARRIDGGLTTLAYAALIVYGSLYPFSGWVSSAEPLAFLTRTLSETRFSLGDLVTNLLAYVPLGLLACRVFLRATRPAAAVLCATAAGFALSLAVELTQAFLPTRVQSNLDLLMNTGGAALGAWVAVIPGSRGRVARLVQELRGNWLASGVSADIALIGLSAWALSRLVPFVPSLDVGKFRASLAPLAASLADPGSFSAWLALAEAFSWAGLGLILRSIVRPEKSGNRLLLLFAASILMAQVPIVGRYLSAEAVIGCGAGLLLAGLLARTGPRTRARLAFFLVFAGFCVAETVAVAPGRLYPFNWIPFRGHMINTMHGIGSLLEAIGVCVALAWAARRGADERSKGWIAWSGGVLVVVGALALELAQRRVPGRAGDITVPLLFAFAWISVWRAGERDIAAVLAVRVTGPMPVSRPRRADHRWLQPLLLHYALAWASLSLAIWFVTRLGSVPYNVRELIYAGHPWRSAAFLAAALCLTIGLPAWLVAWSLQARRGFFLWPVVLALNAYVVWNVLANAVPSESIHDIVGAPVLGWPGQTETCVRFVGLHAAVTLLVSGGAVMALLLFDRARARAGAQWAAWAFLLAPLLHWVIVTQAATDNLTELMRGGGSITTTGLLGAAAVLTFASGSLVSASIAFKQRHLTGLALATAFAIAAYALYQAGTEPAIVKYGKVFSATQFLLSPDRSRYVTDGELLLRYAIAYLSLTAAVVFLQQRAWTAIAARTKVRQ